MKNIFFLETIVFFIGGIILSLVSGSPIMLAICLGADIFLAFIQFIGAKLVFMGEETIPQTDDEEYSSYRSAHSL